MALSPDEIQLIVRGVAELVFLGSVSALIVGMTYSLLVGVGVVAPKAAKKAFKYFEAAFLDPESPVSRAAKRRENALMVRFETRVAKIEGKIAATEGLITAKVVKIENKVGGMHTQINARLTKELSNLPEAPTAEDLWDKMKPSVIQTVRDAGGLDLEAIGKGLREEIVAQMKIVEFDLTPMAEKVIAAVTPVLKEKMEELASADFYKELMKKVRGGRADKAAERDARAVEMMADMIEDPEQAEELARIMKIIPADWKKKYDPEEWVGKYKEAKALLDERGAAETRTRTRGRGTRAGAGGRAPGVP